MNWSVSWKIVPYPRPKLSYTLYSSTYQQSPYASGRFTSPRNISAHFSETAVKLKTWKLTLSNKESVAFKAPSGRPNGKEYLEGNGTEKNELYAAVLTRKVCGWNPKMWSLRQLSSTFFPWCCLLCCTRWFWPFSTRITWYGVPI